MYLNIKGDLREYKRPLVMGIINVTPDSFYASSRTSLDSVRAKAREMLASGADIIDLGGCSTRPGAPIPSEKEEMSRLLPAIKEIREECGADALISVDTFRSNVAAESVNAGADIINDISGGDLDADMFATVAGLKVPYVLMHTRGTPDRMQSLTEYEDIGAEVLRDLAFKTDRLHQLGVSDIIIDPGFGFAKTLDQNYRLLGDLPAFTRIGCPLLVGISRKSMIFKELGITPEEALNGTTALNMTALMNGADILRVHDVKEACECVRLFSAYARNPQNPAHSITTTYSPLP